jgi:hypothetical protein
LGVYSECYGYKWLKFYYKLNCFYFAIAVPSVVVFVDEDFNRSNRFHKISKMVKREESEDEDECSKLWYLVYHVAM